jgi:hypothetical protein
MSFLNTVEADLKAVEIWFTGTPIGKAIEADFKAAVAELEQVAVADLENAVKAIGLSALGGLASGGTNGAIAAGIATAIEQFNSLKTDISTKTINTLVTTVVNQVSSNTAQ